MQHAYSGTGSAGEDKASLPPPTGSNSTEEAPIRIVTFNVNGLRAVLQRLYGPAGTISKFLDDVGSKADILCLQETKLRRSELTASAHQLASAEGWDSFFSCSNSSRGYSGTATFCRTGKTLPFAAELGFSGLLNTDDTFSSATATADPSSSSSSSSPFSTVHQELLTEFSTEELRNLDSEGRVVITDHGSFVLFNIYAPAVTKEDPDQAKARLAFKMRFYTALQRRWEALLAAGRAVIVVGDMNIAPGPLDYPDFDPDFYRNSRPDRLWLQALLSGNKNESYTSLTNASDDAAGDVSGHTNVNTDVIDSNTNRAVFSLRFIDCFRAFYPERKNAFTVWSTATGARINNYGSRIDLTLSAGLYVGKEAPNDGYTIQETNTTTKMNTETGMMQPPPPPPPQNQLDHKQEEQEQVIVNRDVWISAADIEPSVQGSDHCPAWLEVKVNPNNTMGRKYGDERKVAKINKFPCAQIPPPCAMRFCGKQTKLHSWLAMGKTTNTNTTITESTLAAKPQLPQTAATAPATAPVPPTSGGASGSTRPKQMSLKAFMKVPSSNTTTNSTSPAAEDRFELSSGAGSIAMPQKFEPPAAAAAAGWSPPAAASTFLQAELQAAAAHQEKELFAAKGAWQAIQQRMQTPMCLHGDAAVKKKVNKSGPNQGRYFYMCARGKGQGPNAQCSFFKWVEKKPGDAPRTTINHVSGGEGGEGSTKRFKK